MSPRVSANRSDELVVNPNAVTERFIVSSVSEAFLNEVKRCSYVDDVLDRVQPWIKVISVIIDKSKESGRILGLEEAQFEVRIGFDYCWDWDHCFTNL